MTTKLERLVVIEEEIRRGRFPTVEKLCQMFEVKERTIYDDIRQLRENMGLDIQFCRFRGGYYNRNPKKSLPVFDLSDGEVFALTMGKEMLSQYTGTAFETILRSAIEKISERLPDKVKVDLEDIRSMVKFRPGAIVPISRKMFLDLNRACEKNIPVDLVYLAASTGQISERTLFPYRLLENRGTWYVIGWCRLRNDLRMFALHRIKSYNLTDERFTPCEDLDIDAWVESAFQLEHGDEKQRVAIRFDPPSARYVRERTWHPSQELTEHEDGSCTLAFDTESLDEVKRWVLMYGAEAQVLLPEALAQMVKAEFDAALRKYGSPCRKG